jgi:hypothetical protein
VLAFKKAVRAVPMVGILGGGPKVEADTESDGDINLWADSVGDALAQVGLVLTFAIVVRVVLGLSSVW